MDGFVELDPGGRLVRGIARQGNAAGAALAALVAVRANGNYVDYAADGGELGLAVAHATKTPVDCAVFDVDFERCHLAVYWAVHAAGVPAGPVVDAVVAGPVDAGHGEHIAVAAGQVLVLAPVGGPPDADVAGVELALHYDKFLVVVVAAAVEHETQSAGNSAVAVAAAVVHADSAPDAGATGHHSRGNPN